MGGGVVWKSLEVVKSDFRKLLQLLGTSLLFTGDIVLLRVFRGSERERVIELKREGDGSELWKQNAFLIENLTGVK